MVEDVERSALEGAEMGAAHDAMQGTFRGGMTFGEEFLAKQEAFLEKLEAEFSHNGNSIEHARKPLNGTVVKIDGDDFTFYDMPEIPEEVQNYNPPSKETPTESTAREDNMSLDDQKELVGGYEEEPGDFSPEGFHTEFDSLFQEGISIDEYKTNIAKFDELSDQLLGEIENAEPTKQRAMITKMENAIDRMSKNVPVADSPGLREVFDGLEKVTDGLYNKAKEALNARGKLKELLKTLLIILGGTGGIIGAGTVAIESLDD